MLPLSVALPPSGERLRVLAIGCHSDDIEIGCGGTIMSLIAQRPDVEVRWVVLSASGPREAEARGSAERMLEGAAAAEIVLGAFRDGFMPYDGAQVKDFFESLTEAPTPDVILTHQRNDLHQDHRIACELTWNTFRDQVILEYEIPKWDGDLGAPNAFVPLSREVCERKVETLMELFGTQRGKGWFTEDLFMGLMRLRGMESRAPSGFAEAFYARKLVLGLSGPTV